MKLRSHQPLTIAIIAFVLILAVPIYIGIVSNKIANNLTAENSVQQETLSDLAAHALESKMDHLEGIAVAMASSTELQTDMAAGNWTASAAYVRDILNDVQFYDPYIDRVGIVDASGIQQAAYPELQGGIGISVASSSWYQVIQSGAPVAVSNVTKRVSVPQILVVNVGAPVTKNGKNIGYVVLQIPTDHFLQFEQVISLGVYGFAYIVDSAGNVVAHPRYSADTGDVVNLSMVPAVAAVENGESGTLIETVSGEESVITYKPVAHYHWGIITQEPYGQAFGVRDSIVWSFVGEAFAIILVDFLIAYLIYRTLKK